jgi:hypothetical protein
MRRRVVNGSLAGSADVHRATADFRAMLRVCDSLGNPAPTDFDVQH